MSNQIINKSSNNLLNLVKNYWLTINISILLLGIILRIFQLFGDNLTVDNYNLMYKIDLSFTDFYKFRQSTYGLPMIIQYWLTNRIFGSQVSSYMLFSVFTSIISLLLAYWLMQKFFKGKKLLILLAMLFISVNYYSNWLAQYAMLPYGNSLAVSLILLILLIKILIYGLSNKELIAYSVILTIMSFFTTITIIMPAATSILTVVVYKLLFTNSRFRFKRHDNETLVLVDSQKQRAGYGKLKIIYCVPYILVILVKSIVFLSSPVVGVISERRADVSSWFFKTSDYQQNIGGALRYLYNNTISLIYEIFHNIFKIVKFKWLKLFLNQDIFIPIIIIIISILIAFFIFKYLWKSININARNPIFIIGVFFVTTFITMAIAGIASLFPYGNIRYAYYILFPGIIIISYLIYALINKFRGIIKSQILNKMMNILFCIALYLFLYYVISWRYSDIVETKVLNYNVIEKAKRYDGNIILYTKPIGLVLRQVAKDVFKKGYDIGKVPIPGKRLEKNFNKKLKRSIESNEKGNERLMVITNDKVLRGKKYKKFDRIINSYYRLYKTETAPNIHLEYFVRK